MIKPAYPYQYKLYDLINNHPNRSFVFLNPITHFNFFNKNNYYYVSVDKKDQIVGFFYYSIEPPMDHGGYQACNFTMINLSDNRLLFAHDFYHLMVDYIFSESSIINSLIFKSNIKNTIINTYRDFAKRFGHIIKTTETEEKYYIDGALVRSYIKQKRRQNDSNK